MAQYTKAVAISDIPEGSMKTVMVSGKSIAIAHIDGEFFATDDTCTHEYCSLGGDGFLDGNVVTCGCHGAQFDMTTGHVLLLPATVNLQTYKTKIDGTDVLVEV